MGGERAIWLMCRRGLLAVVLTLLPTACGGLEGDHEQDPNTLTQPQQVAVARQQHEVSSATVVTAPPIDDLSAANSRIDLRAFELTSGYCGARRCPAEGVPCTVHSLGPLGVTCACKHAGYLMLCR